MTIFALGTEFIILFSHAALRASHNTFAARFAMTALVTYKVSIHKLSANGTIILSYVFAVLMISYTKELSAITTITMIYIRLLTASATAKLMILCHA